MSGQLDPRVRELCSQIVDEKDQARMLKLITELNGLLERPTEKLGRDANQVAAD
jgi:hypothetical protein